MAQQITRNSNPNLNRTPNSNLDPNLNLNAGMPYIDLKFENKHYMPSLLICGDV